MLASLHSTAAWVGYGHFLVTAKSSLVPGHTTVTLGLALGQLTLRTLLGTQDNPDASVPFWDYRKLSRAIHSHLSLLWHCWAQRKHPTAPELPSTIPSIYRFTLRLFQIHLLGQSKQPDFGGLASFLESSWESKHRFPLECHSQICLGFLSWSILNAPSQEGIRAQTFFIKNSSPPKLPAPLRASFVFLVGGSG